MTDDEKAEIKSIQRMIAQHSVEIMLLEKTVGEMTKLVKSLMASYEKVWRMGKVDG